jgi:hypothetical protein
MQPELFNSFASWCCEPTVGPVCPSVLDKLIWRCPMVRIQNEHADDLPFHRDNEQATSRIPV